MSSEPDAGLITMTLGKRGEKERGRKKKEGGRRKREEEERERKKKERGRQITDTFRGLEAP